MKLTLLIGNNSKKNALYVINFSIYVGSYIIIKESLHDAEEFILTHKNIDLIIVPSGENSGLLKNLIQEANSNPTIISMGSRIDIPNAISLESDTDVKNLVSHAEKALEVNPDEMSKYEIPEYFPMSTSYLELLDITPVDIFIKKSNEFLITLTKESEITDQILNDHHLSHQYLYLKANDRLNFITFFSETILRNIRQSSSSSQTNIEFNYSIYNPQFNTSEFNKNIRYVARDCLKIIKVLSSNIPKLSESLNRLIDNKKLHQFKQFITLAYVLTKTIQQIKWGRHEHKDKLIYAAILHDVIMIDEDEFKIRTNISGVNHFTKEQMDRINNHALMVSNIISNSHQIPQGVHQIVLQHHGTTNGIGFNTEPEANLNPISILFIVCETFTDYILRSPIETFDCFKITAFLRQKYSNKKYAQIIEALEQVDWCQPTLVF